MPIQTSSCAVRRRFPVADSNAEQLDGLNAIRVEVDKILYDLWNQMPRSSEQGPRQSC